MTLASTPSPLSGSLLVDKPVGFTSSDVVVKLKIALTRNGYTTKGFKIGHGGTLDPFATGVLVVLIGEGTKLADTYLHSKKGYRGLVQLGSKTDSADVTGIVTETKEIPNLTNEEWQTHADHFTDEPYFQTPPMHSAKKQQGQALYDLARKGIEVEREAILKKIYRFDVRVSAADPTLLEFDVECESGTYVRVIAEDLAARAGTLAHLKTLVRTQSSDAELGQCSGLDSLITSLGSQKPIAEIASFRFLNQIARHVPELQTTAQAATEVRHGLTRALHQLCMAGQQQYPQQRYVLVRTGNAPLALLEKSQDAPSFRVQRVFNP